MYVADLGFFEGESEEPAFLHISHRKRKKITHRSGKQKKKKIAAEELEPAWVKKKRKFLTGSPRCVLGSDQTALR